MTAPNSSLIVNRRKQGGRAYHLLCCSLIMFIISCGNDSRIPSSGNGAIDFKAQMHVASISDYSLNTARAVAEECAYFDIVSITADVYDASGLKIASGGPWKCSAGSGIINNVAPGNVKVVILCTDSEGKIKLGGEKTGISVAPGETKDAGTIGTYPFVPSFSAPPVISNGELTILLDALPGATEYHILISENSDLSAPLSELFTYKTAFSISGFSENVIYYGQITALDSDGTIGSESQKFMTDPNDADNDRDGYSRNQGDCDDSDATVSPGAAEVCNNRDDDCNDQSDENLTRGTTCGMGPCSGNTGIETCSGGEWGEDTCDPYIGAVSELCNNVDDDCDDSIDEDIICDCMEGDTRPTTCGFGSCASTGEQACVNGVWGSSTCIPGTPSAEVCDNLDNDCDGEVDDNLTQVTSCGAGECAATGERTCAGGIWSDDTCEIGAPSEEICDKLDNDCDGYVDEVCNRLIMIGDNDGFGYGASVVPDNSTLPLSDHPEFNWIFDNQEASERSAADGSQYTDEEPYDQMNFSFTINFPPADSDKFFEALLTLDVSGIQTDGFGTSSLKLDDVDFSSYLPGEQGTFGSDVVVVYISDANLFSDGRLTVDFQGAPFPNPDAIAFDFFSLELRFLGQEF